MGAKNSKKKQAGAPAAAPTKADESAKKADAPADKKAAAAPSAADSAKFTAFLDKLDQIKKDFPENRCAKYLSRDLFLSYTPEQQEILYRCALSGIDNPDVSSVYCQDLST